MCGEVAIIHIFHLQKLPGEELYSQYSSEVTLSEEELISKIKEKHNNFEIDFKNKEVIKILEYTEGNRVKTMKIGNLELPGVEVRTIFGLRSAQFNVKVEENKITFSVTGYGHGVRTKSDRRRQYGKTREPDTRKL